MQFSSTTEFLVHTPELLRNSTIYWDNPPKQGFVIHDILLLNCYKMNDCNTDGRVQFLLIVNPFLKLPSITFTFFLNY